jgi:sulfonate dioxygenase
MRLPEEMESTLLTRSPQYTYTFTINLGAKPLRAPIATAHPLVSTPSPLSSLLTSLEVRTHPVTRLKSLNYNPTFITHIEELNGQESHHTLAFLREHLCNADDLAVRWKWTPGAVAFWDNRVVVHRAVPGGYDTTLREGTRTAVHGERPFFDPDSESLSQRQERLAAEGGKDVNGVGEQKEVVLNN